MSAPLWAMGIELRPFDFVVVFVVVFAFNFDVVFVVDVAEAARFVDRCRVELVDDMRRGPRAMNRWYSPVANPR